MSSFVEICSAISKEKSKMSQPIRGHVAILFSDRLKNINLIENIEVLLHVKFHFNEFREVKPPDSVIQGHDAF